MSSLATSSISNPGGNVNVARSSSGVSGDAFAPGFGSGAPDELFRRGRQFLDGDVFHLHEGLAAAVDLDAQLPRS